MHEHTSIVVDEYLQQIHALINEGAKVKATLLSQRLKSSASTVHATLNRLKRDGLIEINDKKQILLSAQGETMATKLVMRHRLVETFLCDVLKIPWYEVHEHAHVLEHGLTDLVVDKLAEFMNFPKSCPHGTPLPGSQNLLPKNMVSLDQVESGQKVRIIVIEESLEDSKDLMKFFQEKNLIPGQIHLLSEKLEVTQTLVLESAQGSATIPFDIASKIGVLKED